MTVSDIRNTIDQAVTIPALKHAITGILVCTSDGGEAIYERYADLSLTPASNLKLLTAIAALQRLGGEFRYETALLDTGEIRDDGTLDGSLYLRGSGDPSLTSERLRDMVGELRAAGVRRITGKIVGDGAAFDEKWLGAAWQWDEEPYYYSAQIAGLNCDENVIRIQVQPGESVGDPARVLCGGSDAQRLALGSTAYAQVRNTAITVASDSDAGKAPEAKLEFSRVRARNEFLVGGTIPLGASPVTVRLTIEDPARFAATRLAELCSRQGIEVAGVETGRTPGDARMLVRTESAPLTDLLKPFLKESNNLYGEAFLKTIGNGTAQAGAKAIREMLESWGLDTAGLHIFDGSGLSRMNAMTPRLLTKLLRYIESEAAPEIRDAFVNALPIVGVDGTLDDRMKGTAAESAVRAKTGSLDNASSIAGYLTTKAGERLIFAILMNQFAVDDMRIARKTQEEILIALMDLPINRNAGSSSLTGA